MSTPARIPYYPFWAIDAATWVADTEPMTRDEYELLLDQARPELDDGDWLPVLVGDGRVVCPKMFAHENASTAQFEALRLANVSGGTLDYLLVAERRGERVFLHAPGKRDPSGAWYADQGYPHLPLYISGLVRLVRPTAPPGVRSRLSGLAQLGLRRATFRV